MPRVQYVDHAFGEASLRIIHQAVAICQEYADQGFDLTLRQVYYQFVARGLIPNRDSEYKRLGSIINDARLAGLLDWDYIVDRTRNLRAQSHWDQPGMIISDAAYSYRRDKWDGQKYRPEVWVEKDALIGVIEQACEPLDVAHFSCRGYTSQSEVWGAAQRMDKWRDLGQEPIIFHLGDHDPSGIDMTRDIRDRLELFLGLSVEVRRLALNIDQVRRYNPPPNPAKITDSRANGYIAKYGTDSWELDALDPRVIVELIRDAILDIRDEVLWDQAVGIEDAERQGLRKAANHWDSVVKGLSAIPD